MVVVSEAVNGKTILDCIDSSSPGATQCASVIRDIVPAIESIVVEFALNQGDVPGLKEKLSNYVIDYASYLESDDGESWRVGKPVAVELALGLELLASHACGEQPETCRVRFYQDYVPLSLKETFLKEGLETLIVSGGTAGYSA